MALYAVNYEVAHAAEAAREPGFGAIRLQWWRDGLDEVTRGGAPRAHPALQALCAYAPSSAAPMQALVDAREADLEAAPFAAWSDLEAYVDGTAGVLMKQAAAVCGGQVDPTFLGSAARAWGYAGLLRAQEYWRSRGRKFLPEGASADEMAARASAAYLAAKAASRGAPASGFPAFGYVALTPGYLRARLAQRPKPPLILRQARLVLASATGRL